MAIANNVDESQGQRFTDRPIFAFLNQGVFDGEPAAEPTRDISCYHIQLKAAHTILRMHAHMPWRSPPIGRSWRC
jgi:hypothetical protein